jgi:hypothetical protein
MNQLRGMATFRLASNTEPGGAWFEPPIYQVYGPTRAVNIAQIVLRNCGIADLTAEGWHKAALTYDANLTMPDVRFKGWRILPGMGNSGNTLEGIFGISVAAFDQSDREFAGFLRAMHRLVSGNNRVKVGRLDAHEPFGRVENHVQDYGFGESVDYAVGREYYPPEYFTDGNGEMEWRRHVVFLKSARPEGANYFVLRDTFPGGARQPTWWHWLNLDGPEMIVPRANTIEMKTKYGAGTHFWFAGRQQLDAQAVMTFDYGLGPNYHHRAFGKQLGVPNAEDKETKTIFRVAGKPGEDFFYVVYPHKDAERLPTFTQPGRSCIKIVTPESTDYVFVGDRPLEFEKEDVLFVGKAGAIRVFPDRIVFCLAGGSGQVGYKGCVLEGPGPWERVLRPGELKPGLTRLSDGYEKQTVSVDLGEGITVTGEAPFEAKFDGRAIRIKTRGRARVLDVTLPPFILRPELKLDGRQWMAAWTDYAGSNWGRMKNAWLAAVSTLDGEHELVITNMVFPPVWQRPFEPAIVSTAKDGG